MCWLGAGWCFASAIDAGRREIPNHSETRDVHRDAFWTQSIHTWWWKMFESVVLPVPLLVISCPAPTTSEILAHALPLFLDMLPNPCFWVSLLWSIAVPNSPGTQPLGQPPDGLIIIDQAIEARNRDPSGFKRIKLRSYICTCIYIYTHTYL